MEQDPKVKSLAKAMKLLECFTISTPELGVTEIAQMLDLHKSTVHNIATTFVHMGYLSQNPDNGKYYLGIKLLQFSYIINNHMGLQKFLQPYMKRIAREFNMMVYLGVPHGDEVLYIECIFPDETIGWRNILGEHAPMYCTGLGKALLANLPPEQQLACASKPLQRFTDTTLCDQQALLADLALTRARGYAIDNMEHELGITCIGVPFFGHGRRLVAALSLSASSMRLTGDAIAATAERMRAILEPIQHKF